MIKPKGAIGPMRVSEQQTQLVDIYPTLAGLLNLDSIQNDPVDGCDIFSDSFPEHRPARIFWFPQKDYEPVITQLEVLNASRISEARLKFAGYANTTQIEPFPEDGIVVDIGSADEGRLRLVGFGMKRTTDSKDFSTRWGTGETGKLIFSGLRFEEPTELLFSFTANPFVVNENKVMKVETPLSSESVTLKPGFNSYFLNLKFPPGVDPQIKLTYSAAQSPKNLGIGKDERRLSALWGRVSLVYRNLDRDVVYHIGSSDEKGLCLSGFGGKEHTETSAWRWATQKHGKMVLWDLAFSSPTRVEVEFSMSPFITNENKILTLKSKLSTASVLLKPGLSQYKVALEFPARRVPEIDLFYETAESPKNLGLSDDERVLAALWSELKIRRMGSI
jgi:hypothetical protein